MSALSVRNHRTITTTRRRYRSWLRVNVLESRVTPTVSLPDLGTLPHPYTNPSLSSFEAFSPPVSTSQSPSSATVAEWTRIGGPNQTLAITGDSFSNFQDLEAGKDTEFMVYGRTSSSTLLASANTLRVDGPRAAVTLPSSLSSKSMYLVWPGNSDGFGRPVAVNKAELTWAQDGSSPGQTVTVYGHNLDLGDNLTSVFLEPQSWVTPGSGDWAEVTSSNPYQVTFEFPSNWPEGKYEVWAHNGHGKDYGWSNPVMIDIRSPLTSTNSTKTFKVADYNAKPDDGVDDSAEIQQAIDAAHNYAAGGEGATVEFAAGVYDVDTALAMNKEHIVLLGAVDSNGNPATKIMAISATGSGGTTYPSNIVLADNNAKDVTFRNLQFNDNNRQLDQKSNYGQSIVRLRDAIDITFDNVDFRTNNLVYNLFQVAVDLSGGKYLSLVNCDFVTNGSVFLTSATQIRIHNNVFEGVHNVHTMLHFQSSGEASVTNNTASDWLSGNVSPYSYAQGRFIRGEGSFTENLYVANNETINFAPPTPTQQTGGHTNAGEQINFEPHGPMYYGLPVSADDDTATFVDLTTNYLASQGRLTASIIDGKGIGQRRKVTGLNTSTKTITVEPPWTVIPDATSTISLAPAQQNVVIYQNTLDGKEQWMEGSLLGTISKDGDHVASSAIQIGGVAHFIIDDNIITDVRNGIYMQPIMHVDTKATGSEPRPLFDTDFFNYIANNSITNVCKGIAIDTGPPAFANGYADVGYGAAQLGTTVRDNTFAAMKRLFYGNQRSFVMGTEISHQYRGADLNIFEGNLYPDSSETEDTGLRGVDIYGYYDKNTFNSIFRNNIFDGLPSSAIGVNFAIESTPALFGNDWGDAELYASDDQPDHVIELPTRVVRLKWNKTTQSIVEGDPEPPLRNAGTASSANVDTDVDTDWLIADADFPDDEVTPGSVELKIDANRMGLLGTGIYKATVTVTDGELSESMLVEVEVINNPTVGPYKADLPMIRGNDVTTIEAENYDLGGYHTAYEAANSGSSPAPYRTDQSGVHIDKFNEVYYFLIDRENAEWFNYTVNVADDGYYRLEYRVRVSDPTLEISLDVDGTPVSSGGSTPGGTDEYWVTQDAYDYVELTRGVHVLTVRLDADYPTYYSDRVVDFDWLRLSPSGLSLPFAHAAPVVSMFGRTRVEAELYDRGGDDVAYYNWPANTTSDFREEENVLIEEVGSGGPPPLAVLGSAGKAVNYTINVENAGSYAVSFRVMHDFASSGNPGTFSLLEGSSVIISPTSLEIRDTTSFETMEGTAYFTKGLHTVTLSFLTDGPNDITGYVDWLEFTPINLRLHGPDALTEPDPTPSQVDNFKHVGTAFAVNTPGLISELRFWVNDDEFEYSDDKNASHFVNLWRIDETEESGGITVFTDTTALLPNPIEVTSAKLNADWHTVTLSSPVSVQPGLYVVGVNRYTKPSFSLIQDVTGPVSPSVLTIVAGSVSNAIPLTAIPNSVFFFSDPNNSSLNLPNGYFWLDVTFSPVYS